MAKTLDQLPLLPQPLQGTDIILLKTVIDGTPLDFKVDINTFLQDYLKTSEVGTEVNDIIRLVDDGVGNPGLPAVSGALLTNLTFPEATGAQKGSVFLSDATNSGNDVTTGFAATSKAVRDVSLASVQKAGDSMSGTLEFVNNIGMDFTTFGGTSFNGIKLAADDELEVGQITTTFANINTYTSGALNIRDAAGTVVFSFNTNGTISGVNADDITFTPYNFVTATDTQTAIQQVADAALTGGGGDVDGPINFGNGVGISTRNAADTVNISTIFMNGSDNVIIGQSGANFVNNVEIIQGTKLSIKNSAGTEIFSFNTNGTVTGIDSGDISFTDSGITATDVQSAIIEVNDEKLNKNGGSVTGDLILDNGTAITSLNNVGTPVELYKMTPANDFLVGGGATKFVNHDITMGGDYIIRNSGGLALFRFNQDGSSSGIDASDVSSSPTGGITATDTQTAIQQLESNKFNKSGGTISGTVTLPNGISLVGTRSGGGTTNLVKLDASDIVQVGNTSSAGINAYVGSGAFNVRDSSGTVIFSISNSGVVTGISANEIPVTPTGNVSAVNVQAAIAELDTDKLSTTGTAANSNQLGGVAASGYLTTSGKAADSELLDGVNSTSFARNDTTNTFSQLTTFNNNVILQDNRYFNLGNSGDGTLRYDSTNNRIEFRLKSDAQTLEILDNLTPRMTLDRSTGDLTITGDITANNIGASDPVVANHVKAGNMQLWDGSVPSFGGKSVTLDINEGEWGSYGPTGTLGVTDTWTALDQLPSNATAVLLYLEARIDLTSTNRGTVEIRAAKGDLNLTGLTSDGARVGHVNGEGSATDEVGYATEITVPLDANKTFQMRYDESNANSTISIRYRGFLTD